MKEQRETSIGTREYLFSNYLDVEALCRRASRARETSSLKELVIQLYHIRWLKHMYGVSTDNQTLPVSRHASGLSSHHRCATLSANYSQSDPLDHALRRRPFLTGDLLGSRINPPRDARNTGMGVSASSGTYMVDWRGTRTLRILTAGMTRMNRKKVDMDEGNWSDTNVRTGTTSLK